MLLLFAAILQAGQWEVDGHTAMPQGLGMGISYFRGHGESYHTEFVASSMLYISGVELRHAIRVNRGTAVWAEWGVFTTACRFWDEYNGYGGGPFLGAGWGPLGVQAGVTRLALSVPVGGQDFWQPEQWFWFGVRLRIWRSRSHAK